MFASLEIFEAKTLGVHSEVGELAYTVVSMAMKSSHKGGEIQLLGMLTQPTSFQCGTEPTSYIISTPEIGTKNIK
jgi:hypothetical protein